jgi:hypothetical protein
MKPSQVPPPRRVRVYPTGHGVYVLERLGRTNRYPQAHWLGGWRFPQPPRPERTPEAQRAFYAYMREVESQHYKESREWLYFTVDKSHLKNYDYI